MTLQLIDTGGPIRVRAPSFAESDFTLTQTLVDTIVSASSSGPTTIKDAVFDQQSSATIDHEAQLSSSGGLVQYTSLDPSVGTVDAAGRVTRVSSGLARILAEGRLATKRADVLLSRTTGNTTNQFSNWKPGSLAAACTDRLDLLIAGKNVSAKPMFTSMDHAAQAYVRNPNCWTGAVDTSGISVWNSARPGNQQTWQAGTLIHNQVILLAVHYSPPMGVGTTVRFVAMDNTVVNRTIVAESSTQNDLLLAKLDSAVPASINVCKVLPSNWRSYLGTLYTTGRTPGSGVVIPVFVTDQFKSALVIDLWAIVGSVTMLQPTDAERLTFFKTPFVSGDSGHPAALILGNQLIVVGGVSLSPPSENLTFINSVISGWFPAQTANIADLSAYPTY